MRHTGRALADVRHQRGISTLLVTLVILTTITFVVIYTSHAVQMEQKISANDYRSRMAFEAAEAGMEAAIAAIDNGWTRDNDAVLQPNNIYDTNNSGTGDSNAKTFANGSSVTITLTNVPGPNYIGTRIEATGWSDDKVAKRTITQLVANIPPIPNAPDNPLSSRGAVVISGAATIHNPEGHSTIWTGGNASLGANNSTTTMIADKTDTANYPDCLGGSTQCRVVRSSDRYIAGLDIIENDTSLANLQPDSFFENFFGMKKETYRDSMVTVDVAAANVANSTTATPPGANGGLSEVIWIDGGGPNVVTTTTINGLATGCQTGSCDASSQTDRINATDPVIMIFDGNLVLSGNVDIFGVLFVTGNLTITGNVTVAGAIIASGQMQNNVGGSLDVWYNSRILARLNDNTTASGGGGSWKDF